MAFIGDYLHGYVCCVPIHHYGFHSSGAGAEGARPTTVEAAEGRLHNGGWAGGKHRHAQYPSSMIHMINGSLLFTTNSKRHSLGTGLGRRFLNSRNYETLSKVTVDHGIATANAIHMIAKRQKKNIDLCN